MGYEEKRAAVNGGFAYRLVIISEEATKPDGKSAIARREDAKFHEGPDVVEG